MRKVYIIQLSGRREREIRGTLEELQTYFGVASRTIKGLVNKVQDNYERRESACYNRTFVTLKQEPSHD